MIVLFTDFGTSDPYLGQVKAVLQRDAPGTPVVDALNDAPDFAVEPAAHLLAALAPRYPRGSVFLAVIDPGVGGSRDAIVLEADGRRFVGPDNGLLSVLWQRAKRGRCRRILWRPGALSSTLHGRDLFAPVAAALAYRLGERESWRVYPAGVQRALGLAREHRAIGLVEEAPELNAAIVAVGTVRAPWEGECRRCLQLTGGDLVADVQEVYERDPVEGETRQLVDAVIDLPGGCGVSPSLELARDLRGRFGYDVLRLHG